MTCSMFVTKAISSPVKFMAQSILENLFMGHYRIFLWVQVSNKNLFMSEYRVFLGFKVSRKICGQMQGIFTGQSI